MNLAEQQSSSHVSSEVMSGHRGFTYLSIFVPMLKHVLPCIFVLFSFASFGQYRWDFGVNLGASNYLGEIGGIKEERRDFIYDMKINRTQYTFGGFARYRLSPTFAANLGINYGRVKGNDSNSENPARVARNLSFRNDIIEFTARAEVTLYYNNDANGRGYYNPDFRIYGFVGAGVLKHNPKTVYYGDLEEFDGELIALQPLQTEGVDYNLWQFTAPAGLGLYFTFNKVHRIGWELGYRFTLTDYLDDVSTTYAAQSAVSQTNNALAWELSNRTTPEALQLAESLALEQGVDVPNAGSFDPGEKRGDPTNNDGYLLTQFSYSYAFRGKSAFSKSRYGYMKKRGVQRRKARAKF